MTTAIATVWRRLRYTRLRDVLRGNFNASLDWRGVVADAELPSVISDLIHDVARRTRLWNREKVDVARELIAHFKDGLAAGRSQQELLESFGDPTAIAKLIRRAKRRGRPILWHTLRWGSITIATLASIYVLICLYMLTGRPSIKVDYLALINERAQGVPEPERAWPIYRDTLLAMGLKNTNGGDPEPTEGIPGANAKPGDAEWPDLEKYLREHADSIAQLRAAALQPELGFVTSTSFAAFGPEDLELFGATVSAEEQKYFQAQTVEDRWLIAMLLPQIKQLRKVAVLLANDARRAAVAGDAETSMADILALLDVSRHAQEQPFLVNLLVANDIRAKTWETIREVMTTSPALWSESQLRDLAHRIAATPIDWRSGFQGEIECFQDAMQRFYTDDGHGDGRLAFRTSPDMNVFAMLSNLTTTGPAAPPSLSSDGLAMFALPAANLVIASRKEMTEAHQGFVNTALARLDLPLTKQHEVPLPNEELLSERAGAIDQFRYLFVRFFVPAYQVIWNRIASSDSQRDGVLLGIGLEMYHREHGTWPKSLDELSPRWIPSVPVDRITGDPLGYRIVDDRPIIYSVGADLDDDGGRIPSDDDGKPDEELASPMHFNPGTDDAKIPDGDWIIWSPSSN